MQPWIQENTKELWALQVKAVTTEEPQRLIQTLTGAILGCGGWVLSRGADESGMINMLFEFERRQCIEIYTVLVAVGLDLSQAGHMRLTELCQCTRSQNLDCGTEIVGVDMEIYPIAARPSAPVARVSRPA
jgi:hypothetical protein